MTCSDIQTQLLLQSSGELPESEASAVRAHLESCDACQQYATDMAALTGLAQTHLPDDGPSDAVMHTILSQPAPQREEPLRPRVVPFPTQRLVAMAASLAALFMVIALLQSKLNEVTTVAVTTTAPGATVVQTAEAELQVVAALIADVDDHAEGPALEDTTLATLGEELLRMQGFELYDENYLLN